MSSSQKLQQGKNEQEIIQLAAEQVSILLERPVLYAWRKEKGSFSFRSLLRSAGKSFSSL